MFSSRLPFDLTPNALAEVRADLTAHGIRIRDLTLANPTRAGLRYPHDAIAAALSAGARSPYDPDPRGLSKTREAIAAYYAGDGRTVHTECMHCTASTSEAYGMLLRMLCDPGDEICVAYPAYPLFSFLTALESVRLRPYHLRRTPLGHWRISFPSLEAALSERTRAVVVVNPSNPAGSFLQSDELQRLDALCAGHGIALIVDEVFFDYPLGEGTRARSAGTGGESLRFTLNGLSKILGLPQLKLAWILTEGPEDPRREALERLDVISDTYLSAATPVMDAAAALFTLREGLQRQIRQRCTRNLHVARQELGDRLLEPEGGWNALIAFGEEERSEHSRPLQRKSSRQDRLAEGNVSAAEDEQRALRLLREQHVLLHPGYLFDFPEGSWGVVSLLSEPSVFDDAVAHIAEFLR
mgnify:CR=1 FL=1